jgi:4-hydroxy-tetrahydrodipicolinate synthase
MIQVNTSDPDAVSKHLTEIAQRTESPIVVQDYPVITGIPIATTDLVAAVQAVPQIVAVKSEASPSPPAVATLAASLDVPVFGGLGGTCLLDYLPLVNFEFQSGIALDLRKHSLVRRGLIASDAVRTPGAVPPSSMLKVLVQHLARTPGVELPDDVLAG